MTYFSDHLGDYNKNNLFSIYLLFLVNLKEKKHNKEEEDEEIIKIIDEEEEEDEEVASINQRIKCEDNKTPSTTSSSSLSLESTSSSSKISINNNKIFDPDKHCGVVCSLSKLPCMRSLTCKKHSINLRRKVEGRSKSFNDLFKQFRDDKLKIEPPPSKIIKLDDQNGDHQNNNNNNEINLKPISICTYGARYLDNQSNYLVWNRKQDNFRSIVSSSFNNYNLKILSPPPPQPQIETPPPQQKQIVEPILIKLPKQSQTKLAFKRSNSLTKHPIKSPNKPILITPSPQKPPSIKVTPIEAFILPKTTTNNIKIIQTNGNPKPVQMIAKKQPQLIIPKTTTATSPTITKTTKISPKSTNEFIILNGNCINKTPQQQSNINGGSINKLTLISTPPAKPINLIQSPKIQITTKRSINSSSSTSPSTTNDSFTFNSPKYIKLSNGTSTSQNGHQQLILTTANTTNNNSPSVTTTTTTTVLKNGPIQKIKIPNK